uniref:Metalloendopeptidase n=1 Tax=Xiphophorus couchianus TaxID=32473 RepID=A0A3B5KY62_9TELE
MPSLHKSGGILSVNNSSTKYNKRKGKITMTQDKISNKSRQNSYITAIILQLHELKAKENKLVFRRDLKSPKLLEENKPKRYDDIAMPKIFKRNADPCTIVGCKWFKSGEHVYIPYYIDTNYSPEERHQILAVLQRFNKSTCIRFVPFKLKNSDYLYFYTRPNEGCWSYIGRQGGGQFISLERNKCLRTSTVSHEVLHALGFNHEQVRIDRDEYIRVLFQNIKPEQRFNFWKVRTNNMGSPYDYNSVMHYKKYAFSKNGQPTIAARSHQIHSFGNSYGMSNTDIDRVNKLYNCRKN